MRLAALVFLLLVAPALAAEEIPDSRFLPRLSRDLPPAAAEPGPEPVKVRWDFSMPGEVVYRLHHETVANGSGNWVRAPETVTLVEGTLEVRSRGDGRADLVLDTESVAATADGRTVTTQGPQEPAVLEGVTEDGRAPGARSDREALLAVLFPLPPEPLAVGQASSRPIQVPFHLGPLRLTVQGEAVTRLAGWDDVGGTRCARLETDLKLTRVLTPPSDLGSLHAAGRGRSVFWFDPSTRQFTRGSLALRVQGRYGYDRPNPIEGLPKIRITADADLDQYAEILPPGPSGGTLP